MFDILIFVFATLATIIIIVINLPKKEKKIRIEEDIILFDEEIKDVLKKGFKENIENGLSKEPITFLDDSLEEKIKTDWLNRITHSTKEINLIDITTIEKIVKNINKQVKTDELYPEINSIGNTLSETLSKVVNDFVSNINRISSDELSKLEQNTQYAQYAQYTQYAQKLNSKTIYDITPDKYLTLIEEDITNLRYQNKNLVYIGQGIKIIIYLNNPNEFWYLEVEKDTISRYGFNIKQKTQVKNLVAYIKFILGYKLEQDEYSTFSYIKKRIKNEK